MSFKEHTMYSVVCDFDGCGVDAQEDGDYRCWADHRQAMDDTEDREDWQQIDGSDYCGDHWHWCENADDDARPGTSKGCCLTEVVLLVVEEG